MRRVILSFELPEDKNEYDLCNMARDMFTVLWDIDQMARQRLKHDEMNEDAVSVAMYIRDAVSELALDRIE